MEGEPDDHRADAHDEHEGEHQERAERRGFTAE